MKHRFLPLLCAGLLLVSALAGCGAPDTPESDAPAVSREPGQIMGSPDPVDVNVGLILGPPSMGLGQLMNRAEKGETFNHYSFELCGVDYTAVAAKLNQGDFDIATVPSNVASILYMNEDMNEDVKVISIGNLGLLYVLTTDPAIEKLDDLVGKTVYSIGEGGPPEFTFDYLLEEAGLTGKVNFSFRPTPFEVLNLLQEEEGAVALLPQPFVEVAKLLVPGLRVAIDVTEAWDGLNVESGAESVTTVTIARTAFLEEHEQAVLEYLKLAKESTDYCVEHVEEAAAWTEQYETFLNPEIAVEAIPKCNICTITGAPMKEKLSGFLAIMYELSPEAVGGALPDDSFYYMPPET